MPAISTLDDKGQEVVLGHGYETTRLCTTTVEGEPREWTERVRVVKSEVYASTLERGLEKRLATATRHALTPLRGRG